MSDDAQLYADELARCHRLSLDVTATDPRERVPQMRRAKYHAERSRIFTKVGPAATVAFLREEALAALAGSPPGSLSRWFQLHALEFGVEPAESAIEFMEAAAEALIREGVADIVAESGRAARHG